MGTPSGSLALALLLESQSSIKNRNRGPPRRKACLGGPLFLSCGAMGIRTPDLFHAMEARYQLRHSPVTHSREHSQNVTSSTQQVQLEFTPMRRLLRVTRCVRAPLGRGALRASQRRAHAPRARRSYGDSVGLAGARPPPRITEFDQRQKQRTTQTKSVSEWSSVSVLWSYGDSNPRPLPCHGSALPTAP